MKKLILTLFSSLALAGIGPGIPYVVPIQGDCLVGNGGIWTNGGCGTGGGGGGGSGTVTSIGVADSGAGIFSVTGSPVTTSGTIDLALASGTQNKVLATPNGSSGAPTVRALVGADLPNPSATTLGGIESLAATAHQWINTISTSGVPSSTQPNFTDLLGNATVAQGGTGLTTLTTYAVLAGGTTATGNLQQVTANTVSGNVLTSNGPGVLPVWQPASGSGGGVTGSGTANYHTKFSSGTVIANSAWAELGSHGELQYEGGANYGTSGVPLFDLLPGTGAGLYTNSSGDLYGAAEGNDAFHATNNTFFVDYSTFKMPSGGTITTAAGNININPVGSTAIGGGNGFLIGTSSGQTGSLSEGAFGLDRQTTVAAATYAAGLNDAGIPVSYTSTGAVTITLASSNPYTGPGRIQMVYDVGNTAGTNNITIIPTSGKKLNGTVNGTCVISTNGGIALVVAQDTTGDYSCGILPNH